jgi:hypothetical protein
MERKRIRKREKKKGRKERKKWKRIKGEGRRRYEKKAFEN